MKLSLACVPPNIFHEVNNLVPAVPHFVRLALSVVYQYKKQGSVT